MTAPTGNRWVDQDTGEIANPDNIQTDLPGHGQKVKYGPLVTGDGPWPPVDPTSPAPAAPAGEAGQPITTGEAGQPIGDIAGEREVTAGELEGEGRKLGPVVTGEAERVAAENTALDQLKLAIRDLHRRSTDAKTSKAEKRAADAALKQLAKAEYTREDGGREPIRRILARYGYGKPD